MRPEPAVVVTGIGAVTALGGSARATWRGLRAGHTAITGFSRFDATPFRTRLAGEADVPAGWYERRAERLAILNAISRRLSSQLELDELFSTCYDQVRRVMTLDAFFVALYDPEHAVLRLVREVRDGNW